MVRTKVKTRRKPRSSVKAKNDAELLAKAQAMARERYTATLKLLKKRQPPQSWFDQTDCPFIPTKK